MGRHASLGINKGFTSARMTPPTRLLSVLRLLRFHCIHASSSIVGGEFYGLGFGGLGEGFRGSGFGLIS